MSRQALGGGDMPLSIDAINGVHTGKYGHLASQINMAATNLLDAHAVFAKEVLGKLTDPGTWDTSSPLSQDMTRVARMHADALHHCADELTVAARALNQLGPDLNACKTRIIALISRFSGETFGWNNEGVVTDAVTGGSRPPDGRAYAGPTPASETILLQGMMRQFWQIDESCAAVLAQVNAACAQIYVDRSNTAVHVSTSASPTGLDGLLALFGDPNKDLVHNMAETSGETEGYLNAIRAMDFSSKTFEEGLKTYTEMLSHSDDPKIRAMAKSFEDNPGYLKSMKVLESSGYLMAGAAGFVNFLEYREQGANAPASIAESAGTVASGLVVGKGAQGLAKQGFSKLLRGLVGGGEDDALTGAVEAAGATDLAGGGPEDLPGDAVAAVVGLTAFIGGSIGGDDAASAVSQSVNEMVFGKGSDGTAPTTIDPLTLPPDEVKEAAAGPSPTPTGSSTTAEPSVADRGAATSGAGPSPTSESSSKTGGRAKSDRAVPASERQPTNSPKPR